MKILFVHNRYQFRGGEDATVEVERSILESHGHQTSLLAFDNDDIGGAVSKIRSGLHAFYNPGSARALKAALESFRPDIIHVHNLFFKASPAILYQAARMDIPVVMTVHNYRFICANALLLRNNSVCEVCTGKTLPLTGIRSKCYRSSAVETALVTGITGMHKLLHTWEKKIDGIIVPSGFMKGKLAGSSLNYDPSRIYVKHNFVHDQPPSDKPREDFFLFAGRLSMEKGIDTLLQCFKANPQLKLMIAGDGPERQRLEPLLASLPNVTYLGLQSREALMDLMRRSRALIFPSIWYEGLPVTIIEAFLTGTPVIASNLGAMAEMITDQYNGLHFRPGDADDLGSRLAHFDSSPGLRADLYRQARTSYEQLYSPDVHMRAILPIYQQVVNNHKNG